MVFKERNICIFSSSYPSYSGVARDKIFVSRESGSEAEQIFHTAAVFVLILEHIVIVLKEQALLDMESRPMLIFFLGGWGFFYYFFPSISSENQANTLELLKKKTHSNRYQRYL